MTQHKKLITIRRHTLIGGRGRWLRRQKNLLNHSNRLKNSRLPAARAAIRARDLTRTHRERLMAIGFLREVIKG
ncbi:MAG: hypothetical protein JWO71_2819 [Candidatus Acidoferrum typicum]|nr:hypothetical protein [Candidatus Acidoferrum typicum]